MLANKQDVRGALSPGEVARALGLSGEERAEEGEEEGEEKGGGGRSGAEGGGEETRLGASLSSSSPSSLASDRPWKVCGISALQKEGVREAFDWLAGEMASAALGGAC